jgi:putative oxidoreductase
MLRGLMMSDYLQAIGRALISATFIVFGYIQFTNIGNYIDNPAILKAAGLTAHVLGPTLIAYSVAAIDLFGGVLILFGYQTRWAAIVLIAFTLVTLIFVHNFWVMEGAARAANQAHFYKNLGLIGGLLFLIVFGAGRFSLDYSFLQGSHSEPTRDWGKFWL